MNASGATGVLLILICAGAGVPAATAVVAAGYFARSLIFEYVILIPLAGAGAGLYLLLVEKQFRAKRELDILESVVGRGGD